jgi:3-oxoacyl-(acyl-carrier-protein) synthase III
VSAPTLRASSIRGIGAYRPRRAVPNSEIVDRIDSSDEWIRTRSGITSRRIAEPDETVVSMSVWASNAALADAGIEATDVDVVLVATVSHLMQTPAAATLIAHEIGATPAAAFDVSAACAGFTYGIALASDMVRVGTARNVLVIGVEKLSDITNPVDRGTAFIFADGAGAVVVGASEEQGIGPVVWGADGDKYDLIRQTVAWDDVFAEEEKVWPALQMQGASVFRWASFEMAKVANEAMAAAGVTVDDLDAFIPHQANMRITDAMARTLKLPPDVAIARDIAEQGNTSAASVPLAMARLIEEGQIKSGDKALLIAFGAGLAYAAQVVTVP